MGCGADVNANALLTALTAGVDFDLPAVDLDDPDFQIPDDSGIPVPAALTNALLTQGVVGGTGTFDVVMKSISEHLKAEFEKSRITGEQYTKAYIELTAAALGNAVQFLLGRDTAYYQALAAQSQAKIAMAQVVETRVKLEIAKANLATATLEASNQEATYALTKMKLSTEDVQYCILKYQFDNLLPAQKALVVEQTEAQRAQTLDTRLDGVTPVAGLLGKQKDLYGQQITSYKRDAEVKALKLFTDAWITMKTIDEGLLPPGQFSNANLDVMLNRARVNLQLDT